MLNYLLLSDVDLTFQPLSVLVSFSSTRKTMAPRKTKFLFFSKDNDHGSSSIHQLGTNIRRP